MKKLTVAISCYNFGNYIEDCVKSILNQRTNFDFNIIIRDDCSKDNSRSVIENLSENFSGIREIKYVFGHENVGVNKNIQLLLSECDGQYIALLDGDDLLTYENKLQEQVDFLDKNLDFSLSCTAYRYLHLDGSIEPDDERIVTGLKEVVALSDLVHTNYITFGRVFRNYRESFSNLSDSKFYLEMPYDDWALNFEILKHGKAKCETNMCSGLYRITGTGVMTKNSDAEIMETNEKCKRMLVDEYEKFINLK